MTRTAVLFLVVGTLSCATAFSSALKTHVMPRSRMVVSAVEGDDSNRKSPTDMLATAVLSAMLATSAVMPLMVSPEPAFAARSGGRAGGSRSFSSAPRAAPRPAARAAPMGGGGTTTINRNYYGGGGGMMMSPIISPFGYSPFGGMGTGYALGAMSNGGNRQETYRLENQVEKEGDRVQGMEVELAKQQAANAALEKRLEALEK